eukprot:gnl/MRDRNA2_/MRDRNA2_110606_c0_seq1.p1 gnl/MRDRNA2_/MRDRNA2_110606_c0~~gnl/MRDRNA2_/MRDRNA2_110606_c0_seq1.p1  ORF type:complete len:122 (-),score=11.72 gnl/MRDRNA2_/MRDRNA2_110606_c0_seq1:389-754(-)
MSFNVSEQFQSFSSYECDECGLCIDENATVFRQFDHTFCSEACRNRSPANLDHLYTSKRFWTSMTRVESESRPQRSGLRRNTSSSTSVSSLETLGRVSAMHDLTLAPARQDSVACLGAFGK